MPAKIRVKCPHCQQPVNLPMGSMECTKCHQPIPLSRDACFYLHRRSAFYGVATGFGIYINGEPLGYIGNNELLCFPVPYGTYNIHCAVGVARKCQDIQVTLTPENRVAYAQVRMKMGVFVNSFVIDPVDPNTLDL